MKLFSVSMGHLEQTVCCVKAGRERVSQHLGLSLCWRYKGRCTSKNDELDEGSRCQYIKTREDRRGLCLSTGPKPHSK